MLSRNVEVSLYAFLEWVLVYTIERVIAFLHAFRGNDLIVLGRSILQYGKIVWLPRLFSSVVQESSLVTIKSLRQGYSRWPGRGRSNDRTNVVILCCVSRTSWFWIVMATCYPRELFVSVNEDTRQRQAECFVALLVRWIEDAAAFFDFNSWR